MWRLHNDASPGWDRSTAARPGIARALPDVASRLRRTTTSTPIALSQRDQTAAQGKDVAGDRRGARHDLVRIGTSMRPASTRRRQDADTKEPFGAPVLTGGETPIDGGSDRGCEGHRVAHGNRSGCRAPTRRGSRPGIFGRLRARRSPRLPVASVARRRPSRRTSTTPRGTGHGRSRPATRGCAAAAGRTRSRGTARATRTRTASRVIRRGPATLESRPGAGSDARVARSVRAVADAIRLVADIGPSVWGRGARPAEQREWPFSERRHDSVRKLGDARVS